MHFSLTRVFGRTMLGLMLVFALGRPAAAQDVARMADDWRTAYNAKNWPKAIEIGLKLSEIAPQGGVHQYNLACCYALSGEKAKALEWLEKSAAAGFADSELFNTDPDLQTLRNEAAFKAASEKIKATANRDLEAFKKQAESAVVHVFVPNGLDKTKPAPLIVVLHGFGGTAENIAEAWKNAAKEAGAIIVAPQGVRPVQGRGFAWGNLRETEYLVLRALEKASKEHKIDEQRIVLSGFSQGGMRAYELGCKHAQRFRGVVPVAGGIDPAMLPLPASGADKLPRFFIMVGARDEALAANQRIAERFEKAGVPHKLNVYEGVGHTFPNDRDAELRKALEYIFGK